MKVLVALGLVLAVFGVGSGLAALTVAANDPCSTWYGANESEAWSPQPVTNLVPFGTRCEYPPNASTDIAREDHVPGSRSYAAWLAFTAAAFAFSASRWRNAAMRGAACALLTSGVFGLLLAYWGDFAPAAAGSCVLSAPLVLALDVRARANWEASLLFCLVLPFIANVAWFIPGLGGAYVAAAVCVALAGALASFALERAIRPSAARTSAV